MRSFAKIILKFLFYKPDKTTFIHVAALNVFFTMLMNTFLGIEISILQVLHEGQHY